MSESLFSSHEPPKPDIDARLVRALLDAYAAAARTLDDLPYTSEFDSLLAQVRSAGSELPPREVFHRLHNLRKAGKLPKAGRAASAPPRVTPEDEQRLASLVIDRVGTLGQRDQLPYTAAFDELVQQFNAESGRSLSPHEVWRLIAKIAK